MQIPFAAKNRARRLSRRNFPRGIFAGVETALLKFSLAFCLVFRHYEEK